MFPSTSRAVSTIPSRLAGEWKRDRPMSRQSRFETTTYRDHEIRVRAAQASPTARWTQWVDVYADNGSTRLPRIDGQGQTWDTYQDAIAHGFRAGRQLIDRQRQTADA
ncbi:hypothetical protein JWH11_06355 [Xanthomonas melonis]|uniref:Uncharacterized protein n=1 Tax=Xanthomonas melonis TaxID=56456 RepID=A0ABS8NVW6_9XANT|nr:DUF6566 family protein [Xanthomonas melonis]MCD0257844.1 hypothetical protein [Xanthomonas melonis]MCD0266063.1 hypothetical protein [Xanthomonas melonis]